uniref:Uncharacterized protein n=1 Tax=Cacopsylla melanoneura TaxID=428564 RepID=A0A8D8ZEI3_9HEMI
MLYYLPNIKIINAIYPTWVFGKVYNCNITNYRKVYFSQVQMRCMLICSCYIIMFLFLLSSCQEHGTIGPTYVAYIMHYDILHAQASEFLTYRVSPSVRELRKSWGFFDYPVAVNPFVHRIVD